MTEQEFENQLEDLVDKQGLQHLLDRLGEICSLKASHIRENWQDEVTARTWDRDCEILGNVVVEN